MYRPDWWAYVRWKIARDTGWTMEYIESLSMGQVWEYLSVVDGENKGNASVAERNRAAAARKSKRTRRR